MPTNWTSRLPSSTVTNYNEGTWGDSTLWEGILLTPTSWNQRTEITSTSLHNLIDSFENVLIDSSGNALVALSSSSGTSYTTRTII